MKAASARSKAGSLSYIKRQEKHAKREDYLAQKRRDEYAAELGVDPDTLPPPLVYGTLDLEAALEAHLDGAKRNSSAKNVALHMIIRFPPEVLEGEGAGRIVGTEEQRKQVMLDLAVKFVNDTHGGNAVFAARMDRDEKGQTIVDVFYAPVYEKRTKRTPADEKGEMWVSLTKFGKELAQKHEALIKSRLENSKNASKLTSPRAIGIAIQEELAFFMKEEVGLDLEERNEKLYPWSDWRSKEEWQAEQIAMKVAEAHAEKEHELEAKAVDLAQERVQLDKREAALKDREAAIGGREMVLLARREVHKEKAEELAQKEKDVAAAAAAAKLTEEKALKLEQEAKAAARAAAELLAAARAKDEAAKQKSQQVLAREAAVDLRAVELVKGIEDVKRLQDSYDQGLSKMTGVLSRTLKWIKRYVSPSLSDDAKAEMQAIIEDFKSADKELKRNLPRPEEGSMSIKSMLQSLMDRFSGKAAARMAAVDIFSEKPDRVEPKPAPAPEDDDGPSLG